MTNRIAVRVISAAAATALLLVPGVGGDADLAARNA
jgi:hypothetical protein